MYVANAATAATTSTVKEVDRAASSLRGVTAAITAIAAVIDGAAAAPGSRNTRPAVLTVGTRTDTVGALAPATTIRSDLGLHTEHVRRFKPNHPAGATPTTASVACRTAFASAARRVQHGTFADLNRVGCQEIDRPSAQPTCTTDPA